jgi:hypothetical protein
MGNNFLNILMHGIIFLFLSQFWYKPVCVNIAVERKLLANIETAMKKAFLKGYLPLCYYPSRVNKNSRIRLTMWGL